MISKNVQVEERDGVNIVHLLGNVDYAASSALEFQLEILLKKKLPFTILDLSECKYMGSVVVGLLTHYASNAKKHGRVFLIVQTGPVQEMLANFRVLTLFEQADSVDTALSTIRS